MPEITLTPQQALERLKKSQEIMVTPYGDTDQEILEYLNEKDCIQIWY